MKISIIIFSKLETTTKEESISYLCGSEIHMINRLFVKHQVYRFTVIYQSYWPSNNVYIIVSQQT